MSQFFEAYLSDPEIVTGRLLNHAAWSSARPVELTHYWSGELAPVERCASARAIWSNDMLCVRFDYLQYEQFVLSNELHLTKKTIGLWERDVCEIFIAPNASEPERYFEFEAAPTGEWLDLAIHQMTDKRETDWEYSSGMTVASRIEDSKVTIIMRIPFDALGVVPQAGDRWRANLFRCVGSGETRGYMAWQPTLTEQPNFHVPDAFGSLVFVE